MQTAASRLAHRLTHRNLFAFASKELLFGNEARSKMLEGCDMLADAVQVTLGPSGRNVLIDSGYGTVKITKDGVTVAKAIEFSDKFKNMGASLVKSVASKTNDEAGDGTTTATLLARAIFKEALKKVEVGVNLTEMKKGIDLAVGTIVKELQKISIPIKEKSQIKQVATISANGDEHIGELLADLLDKVGNSGVISIGQSKTLKHEIEFIEGMKFDRGYISPYFINNHKEQKVEFERPLILLSEHKVSNFNQILKFVEFAVQKKRPLVIVADDVESEPLANLIVNKVQGGINVVAVKAPSFGDNRKAILNDLAVLTGGTVVSEEVGVTFEDSDESILGTAGKVEITKEDTVLLEGNGDK
jgi:chaperonin GroEL